MRKKNNTKQPSETTKKIFCDVVDLLLDRYYHVPITDATPAIDELHRMCHETERRQAGKTAQKVDKKTFDAAFDKLDVALHGLIRIETDLSKAENRKVNMGKLTCICERVARAYMGHVKGIDADGIRVSLRQKSDGIKIQLTIPKKKACVIPF